MLDSKACGINAAHPNKPATRLDPRGGFFLEQTMVKHEPEVRRAKAKSYVAWCNKTVHEDPWTKGDKTTSGGIYIALELFCGGRDIRENPLGRH
jgi:hypothetical protein